MIARVPAHYYSQFDADYGRKVPAEGFGGWNKAAIDFDMDRMAVVVMHAWDCRTKEQYPGLYRAVEYLPRADKIVREVFPPLLSEVRRAGIRLFHMAGGRDYYKNLPGYQRALEIAGPEPALPQIETDDSLRKLRQFRKENVFVGAHNQEDCWREFKERDFPPQARPRDDEPILEGGHQLFELCRHEGISHLVYIGFAINYCLLTSPGGMVEMRRRGIMCSTIREAVTAVENRETAREELNKREALWRVALEFGFVFDLNDFMSGLGQLKRTG